MSVAENNSKQINQMINFIMQEAHEKVSEIQIKADHDFNLDKQTLVHNGKTKLQEEYAQKEKNLEVEQRVQRSAAVGSARIRKMKARDDLLETLKVEALEKLKAFTKSEKYGEFIKKLLIQGLVQIEEPVVEVQCRAEDKTIVSGVLSDAVSEYKNVMTAAGHSVSPTVTISNNVLNSKTCSGGIVLTALKNKIILDQTVDERLKIAYMDNMPLIRKGLFSQSA